MGDSTREVFNAIYQVLYWIGLLIELGIVAAAFARFKTTPAGLLVGGGFSLIVALSLVSKLIRTALEQAKGDLDAIMGVGAVSSVLQMTLTVVVAVGILLIPSSLEKLSKKSK